MSEISNFILTILVYLHQLTGNLGWAVIIFTIVFRSLLLPLTYKSTKDMHVRAKKQKSLAPELKKLKEKYKDNPAEFNRAQMELFKQHNINPLSGCLPQVLQIGILIFLYRVFTQLFKTPEINGVLLNMDFYWLNLTQKDQLFILPVLAVITQLIFSVMITPGGETPDLLPEKAKSKKVKEANVKEENTADMAESMQKQMMFMLPLMTGFMSIQFPSGLVLYWVVTTLFSIVQQYTISGWGGLQIYASRIVKLISKK